MQRTDVNPWSWSLNYGYVQGLMLEGTRRELVFSGQTAVDGEGNPQHIGNMRGQLALALANLEAVLGAANMGLGNLKKLTIYTVDVDATLQNWDVIAARLGACGVAPPMTLLGVSQLAMPMLLVELDASAVD
ncbi:MAG: RidA family protein [Aestuariivirga sp.]|uniref:RidA family protein n=1 Tax=Aestuariivirga sp. TaxID=2650926 RepID=UPI0025BCED7A|nr:Rid family hydrolase [Aestuariivirga sp.]MCA3561094.1 RidA family protein [Aestuariivirga sp.]